MLMDQLRTTFCEHSYIGHLCLTGFKSRFVCVCKTETGFPPEINQSIIIHSLREEFHKPKPVTTMAPKSATKPFLRKVAIRPPTRL